MLRPLPPPRSSSPTSPWWPWRTCRPPAGSEVYTIRKKHYFLMIKILFKENRKVPPRNIKGCIFLMRIIICQRCIFFTFSWTKRDLLDFTDSPWSNGQCLIQGHYLFLPPSRYAFSPLSPHFKGVLRKQSKPPRWSLIDQENIEESEFGTSEVSVDVIETEAWHKQHCFRNPIDYSL